MTRPRILFCVTLVIGMFAIVDCHAYPKIAEKKGGFFPRSKVNKVICKPVDLRKITELRGGGTDDVKLSVAQTVTAVQLVNSVFRYMFPAQNIKMYYQSPTPDAEYMMQAAATRIFCLAFTSYCIIYRYVDPVRALGLSMMVSFGADIFAFLMRKSVLDMHVSRKKLVNSTYVALGYVAYADNRASLWAIKIFAICQALTGISLAINPIARLHNTWGIHDVSYILRLWSQWYALFSLELGVFAGCLAWGVETIEAVGYSFVPSAFLIADFTFRGPASIFGFNCGLLIGWWMFALVTVFKILVL